MLEIKVVSELDAKLQELLAEFKQDNDDSVCEISPAEEQEKFFAQPYKYVIGLQDEQIVGRIKLYLRDCEFAGQKFVLGGIGGVRVKPQYRKQGIATKLLIKSMEEFKQSGVDIAFLGTDIETLGKHLYSKVGFIALKNDYAFLGKSGKMHIDDGGMIASVNNQELAQKILASEQNLFIGESSL